jgi:signal transduction histidine kinase/DNA-binding response OmpR family regulator
MLIRVEQVVIMKIISTRYIFILLVLCLFSGFPPFQCLYSQSRGFSYFKNYTPKDYDWQPQNWAFVQDNRGIIYAANQGGLLEFDGVNWRKIAVPNIIVRSLALGNDGALYLGGENEFGYFTPGSSGGRHYTSLVNRLKPEYRAFSTVWRCHFTKEGIYFRSTLYLFRWNPGKPEQPIKVWKKNGELPFAASFVCAGRLFFRMNGQGLAEMTGDTFKPLPGGEIFGDKSIYMMVPYDEEGNTFLIGTRRHGFYIFNGKTVTPFPVEANEYIHQGQLYGGIRLGSEAGHFAAATRGGGLVIFDTAGRLKHIFNRDHGLQNNIVRCVFEDMGGNLWLGLDSGITKIEYFSPLSVYDERNHLPGTIYAVVKHGGYLYAGTANGLFKIETARSSTFRRAPGLPATSCWWLLSTGHSLLAATTAGVFEVPDADGAGLQITRGATSYYLRLSAKDAGRVWVGTINGLSAIRYNPDQGRWHKEHEFKEIKRKIKSIIEDPNGTLWLGTEGQGVLRVEFPGKDDITNPRVTVFNENHGLPPSEEFCLSKTAGHVTFAANKSGLYRFDVAQGVFVPDRILGEGFTNGERGVFRLAEDQKGVIWFHSNSENFQALPTADKGKYTIPEGGPTRRIPSVQADVIYPEPGTSIVWFGSQEGLVRFDTARVNTSSTSFDTLIREVQIDGTAQMFDATNRIYKKENFRPQSIPVIPFKQYNISFRFAAVFFRSESATRYRYRLDGYDEDWSDWSAETRKDYTNLDGGRYTFRVRARNIYGSESNEASYAFRILPPWYKTWWAFALYILLAFLGVFLVVKVRSAKLEKEKQKLEQTVKERTKEINNKTRQLEIQTLQLKEQAGKLKELDQAKSRFFANISHEFRTPLTLIMGPLEQIISDYGQKDGGLEKKMRMMLRNSRRLFSLINRLLDLSRLDSGKMKLNAAKQNILPFIKSVVTSFETAASQKELELVFHPPDTGDMLLYFDGEKIEDVLCNLLVNAVKFTPPGGKITVEAKPVTEALEHFPSGFLELSVGDTGPGIPREQLPHIFDRFYQSETSNEHQRQGFGIGLALTRELIRLHRGRIDVHSRAGEDSGTTFTIRLPLGDRHLEPDEISALSQVPAEPEKMLDGLEPEEREETKDTGEEVRPGKDLVLVVEDNGDVRQYIRSSLEPQYQVIEAKDGREGIEKALAVIPDLIISDIMMPRADGYQLCRELKTDIKTSHVPIILLTAKASEASILEGYRTQADDYITKPFSIPVLLARIKNLIDLRRQFQVSIQREMTRQPAEIAISKLDMEFLSDLREVIEKNLDDEDFNVEALSRKLYMSRPTVYRKIRALTGETPGDFIQSYRLKRAAELLEKGSVSVLEVSLEVGFSSASYFTKCFKKKFNRLPSEYQGG